MISITSIITVQCILLYLTSNYMNFTCAFVFEQRSSWAVEMMLAPHRLVVAPPPVVVMHWKRWAFGRLQTKLPKGSKRCVQITAFRQCISECNKNEIFSRPSNTMFFFMCLYNILFECGQLPTNKLGEFRLVLPVPQSTWNLKGMVHQFDPVPVLGISGAYQRTTGGHCPRESNASGHVGCVCSRETSVIRTHTISCGLYFLIFF